MFPLWTGIDSRVAGTVGEGLERFAAGVALG